MIFFLIKAKLEFRCQIFLFCCWLPMKYRMLPMKLEESRKIENRWMSSESVLDLQNCSVAFINAKNGFLTKFHIDMVIQKISQLFFFVEKKYFSKMNKNIFQNQFFQKKYIFSFSKNIFFRRKKKLRNFLDNYVDVEFCQESIFRIHKCNGAVLKVQNTL